jgi:hypothetical protein
MMYKFFACTYFFTIFFYSIPSYGIEIDIKKSAPTANYYGAHYVWGSQWGGSLDTLLRDNLFLDASASQPKGFLSRAYDGNPGSLSEPTGSFLIFDGPVAAFRLVVPNWRKVKSFGAYVMESTESTQASFELFFEHSEGNREQLRMSRKVIAKKNGLAHVKYETELLTTAKSGGEFLFKYQNPDFASAFVSEIVIDGVGEQPILLTSERAGILNWLDEILAVPTMRGLSEFFKGPENIADVFSLMRSWANLFYTWASNLSFGAVQAPSKESPTKWLFWKQHAFGENAKSELHSLIFRTDQSGDRHKDLAPVWLGYPPEKSNEKVPLVVLVSDHNVPGSPLELLGFSGRPEFALATELLSAGLSVLVVAPIFEVRPVSDSDQKDRIKKVLDYVLDAHFIKFTDLDIDEDRIGIWGWGAGAMLALKLTLEDYRIKAAAFSRIDLSCCTANDWSGLRSRFTGALGSRKAILFDNYVMLKDWASIGGSQNVELIEAKYPILTLDEKQTLVNFMNIQIGADGSQISDKK